MAMYDLIVIGSGPAGEKGAAQAAYFGKKTAMIEKAAPRLGGACTNTGTLPSKTLRESALALTGMTSRGLEAAVLSLPKPYHSSTLMHRERMVVGEERERIARNMDRHKVDLFPGTATFVDAHTVKVGDQALTGEFFLVATGSRPHRPSWIPFAEEEIYDSDEILEIETIPDSLIVLGSGVIASEYACIFAALGTHVTMMDGRDRLLGFLDAEVGERFTKELERLGLWLRLGDSPGEWGVDPKKRGWRVAPPVRLGDSPVKCAIDPKTRVCSVTTEKGRVETAAAVLAAAGRSGNTKDLGLEKLGIVVDKRGNVAVDEHFQTAVPHIYAAGDVVGF